MKPWESIIPTSELHFANDHNPVLRQSLTDLGYWQINANLKTALLQFRKEAQQARLLSRRQANVRSSTISLEEIQLLKLITALEGDLPLVLPARGDKNLSTRVLHYRLHLLGLYPATKINHPFSNRSFQALHQLGKWTQLQADSTELLQLTGDLNRLIHRIKRFGKLQEQIVAFQFSEQLLSKEIRRELKFDGGVKEKEKDLKKREVACDRELRKLENQILDKASIARQRLVNTNRGKQSKLLRIRQLLQTINTRQATQYQLHMKIRRDLQKQLKDIRTELHQKTTLLSEMQKTLEKAPNMPGLKAEREIKIMALSLQIKERKKIIKKLQKQRSIFEKKLEKTIQQQQQQQITAQKKSVILKEKIKLLRHQVHGLRFRFKAQLKRSLTPAFYQTVVKKIFSRSNTSHLLAIENAPYNSFLIRLLQLHQWTNGYYNGSLDSHFAEKTFGAIAQMAEDLPSLRLKYILTSLRDQQHGFWVLNIAYLLDCFCKINPVDAPTPKHQEIMERYLAQQGDTSTGPFTPTTKVFFHQRQKQLQTSSSGPSTRRVYHGQRTLLRAFSRVANRIGQIIFKGLKASLRIVENFVLMLYEDAKASIILFTQSLDFLFGKRRKIPLGNNENWDTPKYKYNGFLSVEENTKAAESHFTQAAASSSLPTKSIATTLKILKKVARYAILLSTGAMSWPALVTQLILFCRKWFLRWLKNTLLHRRQELLLMR